MSYFGDEDYVAASPGLIPVESSLGRSTPPPFMPLWLLQDFHDAPLAPVHFENHGDGLAARRQLYDRHGTSFTDREVSETLLLHQMDPRISSFRMPDFVNPRTRQNSYDSSVASFIEEVPVARLSGRIRSLPSSSGWTLPALQTVPTPPTLSMITTLPALAIGPTSTVLPISPTLDIDSDLPSFSILSNRAGRDRVVEVDSPSTVLPTFPAPPAPPIKPRKLSKTRLGLPITLHQDGVLATVLACADTGADENIISDDLAKALGHANYTSLSKKKEFALANGAIVEAIGQIESTCSFGVETEITLSMKCIFYVLLKVATPIIMGMGFLEDTKTMTHHRNRLVRVPRPAFQALSVCSVNRPKKLLACQLNYTNTLATPDSGSETDLMSASFAFERGLKVLPGEAAIEFADGSIAITTGFTRAELSVNADATGQSAVFQKCATAVDFLILEGLVHDLIVGEDSLEELQVFTANQHTLVTAADTSGPLGLNRIRLLGAIDRVKAWIRGKLQGDRRNEEASGLDGLARSLIEDQRENNRREREAARIAALPTSHQDAAMEAELDRQKLYDDPPQSPVLQSNNLNSAHNPRVPSVSSRHLSVSPPQPTGMFRCDFPGCDAAPFQTQYLLNSHANVHSRAKPHYCPVAGCPRSEGGKGFKRKNEMIRHGLVHQSAGCIICPFCPDREIRYPRPDNLQRHVRVRHPEKNRDDPELREALAIRPEGASRGRRRRVQT